MTDADLAMDFGTIDAQLAEPRGVSPTDPWQQRRLLGFGASDIPIVLVALGRRQGRDVPRWMEQKARRIHPWNEPRIFCEKAGLVGSLAAGSAAALGTKREQELLAAWRRRLERSEYDGDHEATLVPSTLRHASEVPREWFPLVCRTQPIVTCTPDGWMRDDLDDLVNVEVKCVRGEAPELRWSWRDQATSQRMVTGSGYSVVVAGERWAHDRDEDGPVRSFLVEPLPALEREIDEAADEGWSTVMELRRRAA